MILEGLLTRLWLGLSRLGCHKYTHNFQDYVFPVFVVMILKQQPPFSITA